MIKRALGAELVLNLPQAAENRNRMWECALKYYNDVENSIIDKLVKSFQTDYELPSKKWAAILTTSCIQRVITIKHRA